MKKKIYRFLLLGAVSLLALTGCQKERWFGSKDAIRFSVGTPGTKTAYSGVVSGGKERIDWVENDVIRIYSDKSQHRYNENQYWADYVIKNPRINTSNTAQSLADIENVPGDGTGNGLIWNVADTYQFYGLYPSSASSSATGAHNGEIALSLPESQDFSVQGDVEHYGFMTAYQKMTTTEDGEGGTVNLAFDPAFTAFEISIRSAGDAVSLKEFRLFSGAGDGTGNAISGGYAVKYDASGNKSIVVSDNAYDHIIVDLTGQIAPATPEDPTAEKQYLTFTVFGLPVTRNDLSVSFTTSQDVTRKLQLKYANGDPISFTGGSKHKIYGLALPNGELLISVGTDPWEEGGENEYVTIEDASLFFPSCKLYLNGQQIWRNTYIATADGYEELPVDAGNPDGPKMYRPINSTPFTLTTISIPTTLELKSDNPNIGFVKFEDGVYSEFLTSIVIPQSEVEEPTYHYGKPVETVFYVVPLNGDVVGQTAGISLVRSDKNTPVAYTHQDLPGSTDHTKELFQVVSPETYNQADSEGGIKTIVPSI